MQSLLFSYYGDDLTGSTDALEAFAGHGIASVLFLGIPDETKLQAFEGCQAIGLAGESRSKSPEWMSAHLPPAFAWLKRLGALVCQYKVCSTFDSSPTTGSIGRVLEIGEEIFAGAFVPIVVAAPKLNRWVAFANLFAGANGAGYRIDRHPTMSRHPVTPMREADLRVHLRQQTDRSVVSLDLTALEGDGGRSKLKELLRGNPDAVLFDGVTESHLDAVRELVRQESAPFVIASSGFTHVLAASRSVEGKPDRAGATDRLIVLSGSASPVTERQILWAAANGFGTVRLDVAALADPAAAGPAITQAVRDALSVLEENRSVVLFSALGPLNCDQTSNREELGRQMGKALRDLLLKSGVKRVVVAGGDTSSHVGKELGIYALTVTALLEAGAPLCRAYSDDAALQGLECIFKGGQIGRDDFFGSALQGTRL